MAAAAGCYKVDTNSNRIIIEISSKDAGIYEAWFYNDLILVYELSHLKILFNNQRPSAEVAPTPCGGHPHTPQLAGGR